MQFIIKHAQLLFVAFLLTTTLCCCHRYYKSTITNLESKEQTANSIKQLKNQNRFFVITNGKESFYMEDLVLSTDQTKLTANLDSIPREHLLYQKRGRRGKLIYKKGIDDAVLTEVHMYVPYDSTLKTGKYELALDKLQRIMVVEKDKGRTTGSFVIGAIGYTIGAMLVAGIIIAATKSSCPFVSAYTGREFELQGEIYGGAIYPQLARDDYMPLRMQPASNGTLQVKISNELQEKQFTDVAELLVITHDKESRVVADEQGNLYQVKEPRKAIRAWTSNREDVLAAIERSNDNMMLHFDDTLANDNTNYLVTRFDKPAVAKKGKLVLGIKNSYWLDYLYGEFAKGFGSYYSSFIKKQYKTPVSKLKQWTKDQNLPLEVSIKTRDGWQKITDITTIGPLATREIVVPVDLSYVMDPVIEIKLSSGFMFWEIDYAAMDFSVPSLFSVETLTPHKAVDETGQDVLSQLLKKDGKYLAQPVPGNMATIEYVCSPQPANTARSYILHTKGYYEHVRDFKGSPKTAFLKQFTQPNAFPKFSSDMYKKFRNTNMALLTKN